MGSTREPRLPVILSISSQFQRSMRLPTSTMVMNVLTGGSFLVPGHPEDQHG
jgi:hypothetical protein